MTNNIDPLNTHTYDGKIDINQLPDLITIRQLTLDQKKERGVELLIAASNILGINPIAIYHLKGIIESMGTLLNIDMTNGLFADDLICICWVYRYNSEFMAELETQLMDMNSGFCPQGRTHRLFQILVAFM
jgi:hypothetical protein